MNAQAVLAIAWKDILDAVKNRYLLMSLILPVGMSVVFQLVFGRISNMDALRVAVFDAGGSRLTECLRAVPNLTLVVVESQDRLSEEVDGEAVGGIAVPAGFDSDVDLGRRPKLTVWLNGNKGGGELALFREILIRQVWAMKTDSEPVEIVWSQIPDRPEAAREEGFRKEGFRMDWYLLVMFLVMSLTMTGSFVVPLLMVEEKEKHTMEFLLVAPITPAEIAAGKALTGLIYSGLGAAVLVALNRGWTGAWPVTFLALLVGALFMVLTGLLMGTLLHATMQVNTWSTVVVLILLAPSWLSVLELPTFLESALRAVPTYYLVEMLGQSIAGQVAPLDAAVRLLYLAACTAALFGIVVWAMRRQEA
ncbi:MAG: ABC transporter permease [Anaerolineales bacterium]|nr:ABC transporter permease [Anaerolineales bacterium]